jgi:amino acid adenylation domain-containing protein
MPETDAADDASGWHPVRNHSGDHSVWRSDRILPPGWRLCGPTADRETALDAAAGLAGETRRVSSAPAGGADHRIIAAAHRFPTRTAVVTEAGATTYAELADRAARARARLQSRGVGRGCLVGICMSRSVDLLATTLAVLSLGAAYVPLDGRYPAERLRAIAEDSRMACVVGEPAFEPALTLMPVPVLAPADVFAGTSGAPLESVSVLDDVAYVMYTSGSTGRAKGVEVTHGNLIALLDALSALLPPGSGDRVLFHGRFAFDISVPEYHLPLTTGGACVLAPDTWVPRPRRLAALVAETRPTLLQATPVAWRLLLDAGVRPAADQVVLCGGDALPAALAGELARLPARAFNMYGPTEATVWATAWEITGDRPFIGSAMAHAGVHVLDDDGNPVPDGGYGEAYISGPAVARGYRGLPRLTARHFVPDPWSSVPGARMYATGDLVRVVGGLLEFSHRRDTQVKVNGNRIELSEVETVAGAVDGVSAAVAAVVTTESGPALVLYVAGSSQVDQPVRAALRRSLPPAMYPAEVMVLDRLPATANGKIDRTELARMWQAGGPASVSPVRGSRAVIDVDGVPS